MVATEENVGGEVMAIVGFVELPNNLDCNACRKSTKQSTQQELWAEIILIESKCREFTCPYDNKCHEGFAHTNCQAMQELKQKRGIK